MNKIGWEIRPIGWVILVVLIGFAIYLVHKQSETSNKGRSG
jgi:tryptophan-rich sensory protein